MSIGVGLVSGYPRAARNRARVSLRWTEAFECGHLIVVECDRTERDQASIDESDHSHAARQRLQRHVYLADDRQDVVVNRRELDARQTFPCRNGAVTWQIADYFCAGLSASVEWSLAWPGIGIAFASSCLLIGVMAGSLPLAASAGVAPPTAASADGTSGVDVDAVAGADGDARRAPDMA